MSVPLVVSAVTCLGCGCICDDIEVVLDRSAIIETRHACALGARWFGTGAAPTRARVDGKDVSVDEAVTKAAAILSNATRPRVLLGTDVSCETYAEAVACADLLHARLDATSSPFTMATILAIQERGIATATLGEIRNRADVVVFWGVDPSVDFPRYQSRVAPDPVGTHVPNGRSSRTVIAVDIGDARGPSDADVRVALPKTAEIDTLIALAALLEGADSTDGVARTLADHLRRGRYVAIVSEVERGADNAGGRAHRLLALGHALNVSGRGALSLLRGRGNRCGAEAVMTRQTGYPSAIDFASGVPRYRPHARPSNAQHDAVLLVGEASDPAAGLSTLGDAPAVVIGPRASEGPFSGARVTIDSATAGIHASGTAFRMDDVPIPLKRVVSGPPDATMICEALRHRLQSVLSVPLDPRSLA